VIQVGSALSKSLDGDGKYLGGGWRRIYVGRPYFIVPEHRQTPRPALALSSQAAVSSHPKLLTPVRVSVAFINYSKKI